MFPVACRRSGGRIVDLTPEQFHSIANTGEALIIDIRNEVGWNWGHIENATYIRNFVPYMQRAEPWQINASLQLLGLMPCLEHCTTIGTFSNRIYHFFFLRYFNSSLLTGVNVSPI
jgi:hypothetical protein